MVGAMVSTHYNLVGLARVSTVAQDAQLQRDALTAAGCGRIFEEKVSTRVAPHVRDWPPPWTICGRTTVASSRCGNLTGSDVPSRTS